MTFRIFNYENWSLMQRKELANSLKGLLEKEIKIYQSHAAVLAEEGKMLTRFKAEKVSELTAKREQLYEEMREARQKRTEFVKSISGDEKTKLTIAIQQNFIGTDALQLLKLANTLRDEVTKTRRNGLEFNQVVNFAINLVQGTLSLFSAATQNVTRSYSPQGKIKESFHPTESRHAGVIKQA